MSTWRPQEAADLRQRFRARDLPYSFSKITSRKPSGFSVLFFPAAPAASPKHTIPERALDRNASIFHIRNWLSDSVQPRILPRLRAATILNLLGSLPWRLADQDHQCGSQRRVRHKECIDHPAFREHPGRNGSHVRYAPCRRKRDVEHVIRRHCPDNESGSRSN